MDGRKANVLCRSNNCKRQINRYGYLHVTCGKPNNNHIIFQSIMIIIKLQNQCKVLPYCKSFQSCNWTDVSELFFLLLLLLFAPSSSSLPSSSVFGTSAFVSLNGAANSNRFICFKHQLDDYYLQASWRSWYFTHHFFPLFYSHWNGYIKHFAANTSFQKKKFARFY